MTEPTDAEIIALCGSRQSTADSHRAPVLDYPPLPTTYYSDSVTAPAGPIKPLPYEPTSAQAADLYRLNLS